MDSCTCLTAWPVWMTRILQAPGDVFRCYGRSRRCPGQAKSVWIRRASDVSQKWCCKNMQKSILNWTQQSMKKPLSSYIHIYIYSYHYYPLANIACFSCHVVAMCQRQVVLLEIVQLGEIATAWAALHVSLGSMKRKIFASPVALKIMCPGFDPKIDEENFRRPWRWW